MNGISEFLGINFVVIGPTLALLFTTLVLLFCTITISTPVYVKKYISFIGILITLFTIFLKFGLFASDGITSYFSEKILLDVILFSWKCSYRINFTVNIQFLLENFRRN